MCVCICVSVVCGWGTAAASVVTWLLLLLLCAQVWGSKAKTEVVMQLLGLGHCRDTLVGDGGLMLRGISGGERKRLTTAEMVVGPQRVLLMDEISTGLDSATLHSVITFFTAVRGATTRDSRAGQSSTRTACCAGSDVAALLPLCLFVCASL